MSWKTTCAPKNHGGLGVKDIAMFNEALLTKWKWNLFHDRGSLWVRVLESNYEGNISLSGEKLKSYESFWWRDFKLVCGGRSDGWFDNILEWTIHCYFYIYSCLHEVLPLELCAPL